MLGIVGCKWDLGIDTDQYIEVIDCSYHTLFAMWLASHPTGPDTKIVVFKDAYLAVDARMYATRGNRAYVEYISAYRQKGISVILVAPEVSMIDKRLRESADWTLQFRENASQPSVRILVGRILNSLLGGDGK